MNFFIRRILRKGKALSFKFMGNSVLKNRVSLLNHFNIQTILDVGANTGQFAYYTRYFGYKNRIISFEPVREPFNILSRFSKYDKKWDVVNYALGNINGEAEMFIAANSVSSSILEMMPVQLAVEPGSYNTSKEKVSVHRLDSIINDYVSYKEHMYLKIDTQGFEKRILDGAEEILRHIAGLQIELSLVELYKGESLFHELMPFIQNMGFELFSLEPVFQNKKTGQLLQADAIFYRK